MITQLFSVTVPGFALGAAFMALANRKVAHETARGRWLKLGVFFLIVHLVLGVAAIGRPWVSVLVAFILCAGCVELARAWTKMPAPRCAAIWPAFVAIGVLALAASWRLPASQFAFLFLVTAACDGFSQVVGQLVGRHRLAPRISPGKTIEGLSGGLFAAVVVALLARALLVEWSPLLTALVALATAFAGLAGDLAASWAKRRAGIKDYSTALPGQGGFLDRFDSLLGALAIAGIALLAADA